MINFYRRFIANYSEVAASLTPLTGGPNGPIDMSNEQLAAFQRLKASLADATILVFPNPDAQLSLMVDASKTAIGAVLNQGEGDHRQSPFSSRKLYSQQSSASAHLDESCSRRT